MKTFENKPRPQAKVGDKFILYIADEYCLNLGYKNGDILELKYNDDSECPLFKHESLDLKPIYMEWFNLSPIFDKKSIREESEICIKENPELYEAKENPYYAKFITTRIAKK